MLAKKLDDKLALAVEFEDDYAILFRVKDWVLNLVKIFPASS